MASPTNWDKVSESSKKWKQYNQNLGSGTGAKGSAKVEVWEHRHGDIDVVLFKSPRQGDYNISVNGSDQGRADFDTVGFRMKDIKNKDKARNALMAQLHKNSDAMGILSKGKDNLHEVHAVKLSTYSSTGMKATKYASSSAKDIAQDLEEEYNVRTVVGDVRGRTQRSFSEGGNYGGEIPIYADRKLSKKQVRKVVNS